MKLLERMRAGVSRWSYSSVSVLAAVSSFGAYTCMYAFRKAFAAGTFAGDQYFHVDYKVWLVIAQIIGYTMSKFYGIRFISEIKGRRGLTMLILIGTAWLALLFFAIVPAPYNIIFLFINGFPLGLIWGLVFSYIEGRKSTEFTGSVLSISLIFASGFVKTIALTLQHLFRLTDFQMPFFTGAAFAIPLLLFTLLLELIPPPTPEDIKLRTKRVPMNAAERKNFIKNFLPGIIFTLIIYTMLTVMRDMRDNFEPEIWASMGVKNRLIFTSVDSQISIIVLIAMSLLILVRQNLKAFNIIHLMIIAGCLLIGLSTVLYAFKLVGPAGWMTMAGLGLYLGYVPYNAIFFERLIATFHYKSNVGFLIYVADSIGYLGSVSLMLVKELGKPHISWGDFFREAVVVVAIVGGVCATLSLIYFWMKARKQHKSMQPEGEAAYSLI